jgi:hypothetical protein
VGDDDRLARTDDAVGDLGRADVGDGYRRRGRR